MARPDFISISRLLTDGRPDGFPVAQNQQGLRSWTDLVSAVTGLAVLLQERDADSWLIATDDAYDLAIAMLAVLQSGKRVLLPATLQEGHLGELASTADGVLLGDQTWCSAAQTVLIREGAGASGPLTCNPIDPNAATLVLHTSGSTGRPEPVAKPLRCLEAEVAVLEKVFGAMGGESVLATVPPYHIYGLLFRVLWPLAAGRVMDAKGFTFPEELARLATRRRAPLLVTSPAFLKRALPLLDLPQLGKNLHGVFSSGGPLPADIAAAYNAKLPCQVTEIYGSTETGGIARRVVANAAEPPAWIPMPGIEVSLAGDGMSLAVRSPFLASDESFVTGDCGRLLADGSFYLEGRRDRIVKIEERRVSLVEIEDRLRQNEAVADIRVLAIEIEGSRKQLGCVIVPSQSGWQLLAAQGKVALRERLLAGLKPHLEAIALPRRWRFVSQLPESEQGKVAQAALLALFQPQAGRMVVPKILGRSQSGARLVIELQLDAGLVYFDGHFDEAAILPGVVQLDWAIQQAREFFPISGGFLRIEALKFFHVLPAGSDVRLQIDFDAEKSSLSFIYSTDEATHSSGRVRFEAVR